MGLFLRFLGKELSNGCCLDTLVRFPAVTAAEARPELRVNSVDFEVGENDHIIR